MSTAAYSAAPGLRSSHLKRAWQSALHFTQPDDITPSPAMSLGSLLHRMVERSTTDTAELDVVLVAGEQTAEAKRLRAAQDASGIIAVTAEQIARAQTLHACLWAHGDASHILAAASHEVHVWRDVEPVGRIKALMDITSTNPRNGRTCIADLKTSICSAPEKFAYAVRDYGYDISAAHYMLASGHTWSGSDWRTAEGEIVDWIWIVAQTSGPAAVDVYSAPTDWLRAGLHRWQVCAARIAAVARGEVAESYTGGVMRDLPLDWATRAMLRGQ